MGGTIKVVRVQLDNELPAFGMVHGHVPAASDAQVVALGNEMHYALVVLEPVYDFRGAVRGVVVHDYQVEVKSGFLRQHAAHGVFDGARPVAYRDDDRCFMGKICGLEIHFIEFVRGKIGTDLFQVCRAGLFHLDLYGAVFGIYVVEILFPAFAQVGLCFRVEVFVQMEQFPVAAEIQAQVIPSGKLVIRHVVLRRVGFQYLSAY